MNREQFEKTEAYVYKQLRKSQIDLIHANGRGDKRAAENIQEKFALWNVIDEAMYYYKWMFFS